MEADIVRKWYRSTPIPGQLAWVMIVAALREQTAANRERRAFEITLESYKKREPSRAGSFVKSPPNATARENEGPNSISQAGGAFTKYSVRR